MIDRVKKILGLGSPKTGNKLIIIPTRIIDQSNVDAFEAELKARIKG